MAKIVIDPGHGGTDPGATSGKNQEKNFNLAIALKVRDYLNTHYQAQLLMTRTTDKTVSLRQRTNFANNNNADYFCSIHINAGGGTGWESFIYNGAVSEQTKRAQNTIHNKVVNVLSSKYNVRDRGKKRANFHVLRETRMPAILMENLFIDTTKDLNLLRNNAFISDLGQAIGEGVAEALSLKAKQPTDPGQPTLYKVIAGSFQNRANAANRVQFLKQNDIDAFAKKITIDGNDWFRVQAGAFRERAHAQRHLDRIKKLNIDAYILQD